MDKGQKLKYDKLKATQGRAIAANNASLCLPVYRSIVARTTETITPVIDNFIQENTNKPGRPGHNAAAYPIIRDLGSRKAAAIAISVVVNHFHAPHSYQSLVTRIGAEIAIEWTIQQEDPKLVANINKFRYGYVGTKRKTEYLKATLTKITGKALQNVDTITKISIGNVLLGIIERTELIEVARTNKRDTYNVRASAKVLQYLEDRIETQACDSPVIFPQINAITEATPENIIKPQRGRRVSDSYIQSSDCNLIQASNLINNTTWTVNEEQYSFVKECAEARTSIMGLPYVFSDTFPTFTNEMSNQQKINVKKARAKLHSKRNRNTAQRVRLLSGLSMLHQYAGKPCHFESKADFRGRLYLTSDLVSYQGPDWLRSLWQFYEGMPIETEEQRNWLFIHTANCYGHNRINYADRISFVLKNKENIIKIASSPWEHLSLLEEAADPFRFLASCREVKNFFEGGYGTLSYIPVQMDATSQGIQIWATISNDVDLMRASNVLEDTASPRDVYQELANIINDIARTSQDPRCTWFRKNPITRKLAKSVLIVIPYGGTLYALRDIIDSQDWDAPFKARGWLCITLWEQARDILASLVKCQQRASQAVSAHHRENPGKQCYEWYAPSGMVVRQRYMKDKRIRVKNVLNQTIHSYRIETDTVDIRRSAAAFPPNFIHSLDSSILCLGLVNSYNKYKVKDYMTIHDCVGVHAGVAPLVHSELSTSFKDILNSSDVKRLILNTSCNGGLAPYTLPMLIDESVKLSSYLFS